VIEALRQVLPAARELGLSTRSAEDVLDEASERLGLAADVYIVALVGGTGVGKSSVLNGLAEETISPVGVTRPTTGLPVAWLPGRWAGDLGPLFDRLGISSRQLHTDEGLERVVVLDLPDVDSLAVEHRAVVESLLPRVDVVAWVTDPEKYADAVLHDGFLRHWLPRLDRQIVILNKGDRLAGNASARVVDDLEALIAAELPARGRPPGIIVTTAVNGASGVAELRQWLEDASDAKVVVAARLGAAARSELAELAMAGGVDRGYAPLLSPEARRKAVADAVEEVLRVVDLRGVAGRAVGATRAEARRRGTGPAGLLTSTLLRLVGRAGAATQPVEYLRTWRSRGTVVAGGEAIRAAVLDALAELPAPIRGRYATAGAEDLERRLGAAVDRAVARYEGATPPRSRWWSVLGVLQSANQVAIAAVAAWIVVWFVLRPDLPDIVLPVVGPLPAPLVLLAAALLAGYLLARVLSVHAGWLGRRWAARLGSGLRRDVDETVAASAFTSVDRLDAARATLAEARELAAGDGGGSAGGRLWGRVAARLPGGLRRPS
jgi:GTP-binding protein EngB required for normal cell division